MYKIYRNLHNGKLSIKDGTTGLVVGHADAVDLFLAKFKVNKAGVLRIRRDKQKSVVATVDGGISWMIGFVPYKGRDVRQCTQHVPGGKPRYVAFNPYLWDTFVEHKTEFAVRSAEVISIDGSGRMVAWGLR